MHLISTVPLSTDDVTKQELYKKLTAVPSVKEVSFSDGSMGLLDNHGIQPVEIQGHCRNLWGALRQGLLKIPVLHGGMPDADPDDRLHGVDEQEAQIIRGGSFFNQE